MNNRDTIRACIGTIDRGIYIESEDRDEYLCIDLREDGVIKVNCLDDKKSTHISYMEFIRLMRSHINDE